MDAFAVDFDTGVPSIEGLMEDVLASPALEREDALGGSPRAGLSFGALDTYDDFGRCSWVLVGSDHARPDPLIPTAATFLAPGCHRVCIIGYLPIVEFALPA